MVTAVRGKPRGDLIPKSIGAAWRRASEVRFRRVPHNDLRTLFDWIVSAMTPSARSRLMTEMSETGPRTTSAQPERRKGRRPSARQGRRKGPRAAARPQRRKAPRTSAAKERRSGVRNPNVKERRKSKRHG